MTIILTLIIAGAGVFSQLQKKKQAQSSPPDNLNAPDDIWSLFNDNEMKNNMTGDPYADKEVFVEEPGPAVNEQNYSFNSINEGGKIIEPVVSKPVVSVKRQPVILGKSQLRQAIIYSEILNRKYF